jgi:hypothetical protein
MWSFLCRSIRTELRKNAGFYHGFRFDRKILYILYAVMVPRMRMNFRQRFAWLLLFIYLGGTLVVMYYILDLSDHYGSYTLEHTKIFHSVSEKKKDLAAAIIWQHIADVPFAVWVILGCIPYLQFFWILLLCTKSQPRAHFRASIIPFIGWFYICSTRNEGRGTGSSNQDRKQNQYRMRKEDCNRLT